MSAHNNTTTAILGAAIALVAIAPTFATPAAAKGGREVIVQDYQFSKPMHGYSGHAIGGYYCDYQRIPNRVCSVVGGTEKCVIKGWTLRQMCQ